MTHASADSPGVLVVDDNEQNRALVEATLADEGYRVVLAASGREALVAIEEQSFGCVLLDVRMPEMSGFEVCRRMRASPRAADTAIVFLTALRDVETFDAALEAGGDDFLTKPLRPAELLVRVQAALELRRLSAENRGYYALLREQRDALMRLQLQKDELTAFLVHDLKNPVNALDMHAQLLLRDKALADPARESARAIRQEARRLNQLISNMLDIGKAEAGELAVRRTSIDVSALVEDVLAEFRMRAEAKEVSFSTSIEPGTLHADAELIRRVLENLLDNALRHAPSGSSISLRYERTALGPELRVGDRGPGVPDDMRVHVFERFVQAASANPQRAGHGLGLAFCRLAVAEHGGAIWVEDGSPGALFCMRLPDGT